jgi:hypothetical protein
MRIILTRDSVCAGDDSDAPHEVVWDFPGEVSAQVLLERAAKDYCIHMTNASWIAYENRRRANGRPIAVISADWPAPRFLPRVDASLPLATSDGVAELDFRYDCRQDPEALWQRMTDAAAV